jgi:hypothetical protein
MEVLSEERGSAMAAKSKRKTKKTAKRKTGKRTIAKKATARLKARTRASVRKAAPKKRKAAPKKAAFAPKIAPPAPKAGPANFTLTGAAPAAGAAIATLGLLDYVAEAAKLLLSRHPGVVFTSGRRDSRQQADAMAGNVAMKRRWIEETYLATAERTALQAWVDANPAAVTKEQISAGLQSVMASWTDEQKRRISRHFSGQAFDVNPVSGPAGEAIKASIRALPNLRKFLPEEGGQVIWHADFER